MRDLSIMEKVYVVMRMGNRTSYKGKTLATRTGINTKKLAPVLKEMEKLHLIKREQGSNVMRYSLIDRKTTIEGQLKKKEDGGI
ncbi:MAG: hypothetical protein QXL94_01520 [Candidatus Parvarchaeum sp.]